MKANRVGKMLMAMVLSASLMAEPVMGTVVHAEETKMTQEVPTEDSTGEEDEEKQEESGQESAQTDAADIEGEEPSDEKETAEEEENAGDETSGDELAEGEDSAQEEAAEGKENTEERPEEAEEEKEQNDKEDAKISANFTELPVSYHLTSSQKEEKSVLADNAGDIREEDEGKLYVTGQVMTTAESREEAEQIAEAYHAEIVDYEYGILLMELEEDTSVHDAVKAAASAQVNLPAVWPNYYRHADVGNEELLEIEESEYELEENGEAVADVYKQAAVGDPCLDPDYGDNYQWHHVAVGSPYAWTEGYTGQHIKVAVLDSGVSAHEDLNIKENYTVYDGGSTNDVIGHGTHVAGIIGAKRNNGKGGAGIAPDAELYNIRVLNLDEKGKAVAPDSDIIKGINKAIEYDVDLINMSLGGVGYNALFEKVVDDAYDKGIAVFASAGNDGGSTLNYPAGYDHVICVAATDNGNGRAAFSTYGSWVDLSAPGAYIYSTYNGGDYKILSGTSMACPVATGEAAVILSSDIFRAEEKGPTRVDKLKSVMKKNTVKVSGSGMGAGITSLTKVLHLSTADMKPGAPSIYMMLADNKQYVQVRIEAQGGMTMYYTTNGKNPVYKDGNPGEDTFLYNGVFSIDCAQTAKGTVKAIAVNESGVVSPVKSQSYTLAPYVTEITVNGPSKVEKGKSISLSAVVMPTYAVNKKVTWKLLTKEGTEVDTAKIKIDPKSGKVTTTANTVPDTYRVVVTAQDDHHFETTYMIQVVETGATVQSIAFDKNVGKELWITNETPIPTVDLKSSLIAQEKSGDGSYTNIAAENLPDRIVWTSSNTKVATVDKATGIVTAKAAGSVTITAKANDNAGKKATLKLTVKQGVTGITITTAKGNTESSYFKVAAGKTLALKARIEPAKPANKKIIWSINSTDDKVTINPTTGKLTVKADASKREYQITARAADGQGAVTTQKVTVYSGIVNQISLDKKKAVIYTTNAGEGKSNQAEITATIKGTEGFDPNAYIVTSSNESVVKVSQMLTDDKITITITATGKMCGKANVVIASTDGSNKKASCAVTVNGGITKMEIQNDQSEKVTGLTLFRQGTGTSAPTTATLNAVVVGSDGANVKAYKVESSNPNLVSATVNNDGKIILTAASNRATGKAKITLMATDGSKKKAVCNVTVANPVSKINISSKTITRSGSGYKMAVIPGKSLQLCATLETEYGAVSDKGVTWEIVSMGQDDVASISSSGKFTVKKGAETNKNYKVRATAKDGSGVSADYVIRVVEPASYVELYDTKGNFIPTYTFKYGRKYQFVYEKPVLHDEEGVQLFYKYVIKSNVTGGYITATSSNRSVMEAESSGGYLYLTPRKPGNVSVTLRATDGSDTKIVYKFRIVK